MEARASRRLLFGSSYPACSIQIDAMHPRPLTRDIDPGTRGIGGATSRPWDGIPTIWNGLIGLSGPRIAVDHRAAANLP